MLQLPSEPIQTFAPLKKNRRPKPLIWHKGFAFVVFNGDDAIGAEKYRRANGGFVHATTSFAKLPPNVIAGVWQIVAERRGSMRDVLDTLQLKSGNAEKMRSAAHRAYKVCNAALLARDKKPLNGNGQVPILSESAGLADLDADDLNAEVAKYGPMIDETESDEA